MAFTASAAAPATATTDVLEEYRFLGTPPTWDSFEVGNGFGPFTVQRTLLRNEILELANPFRSVHISGSKASGKTVLLKLIGKDLLEQGKLVYMFNNSKDIDECRAAIKRKALDREVYFLIDETQANVDSSVFTFLLKNEVHHNATTIGAGVPLFASMSSSFVRTIRTHQLFLTSQDLIDEGVVQYFVGESPPAVRNEIENAIESVRDYVGGHIYPLMRISELLVPKLNNESFTADRAMSLFNSSQFRSTSEFLDLSKRILPSLEDVDIRGLFAPIQYELSPAVIELRKRGFCDDNGKIVSELLLDTFMSSFGGSRSSPFTSLQPALQGVQELLSWGVPQLQWQQYDSHGGATEDALTFELLRILSHVKPLGVMLFNPKLIMAGTSGQRPDGYFNSTVNSYVECVLTTASTVTARRDVEEHMLRFFPTEKKSSAYYEIQQANFAILHYQRWGSAPMELEDETCRQCFNEKVFTLLMTASPPQLYLGNTLLTQF